MIDWDHENSKWRNETIAPLDRRSTANFSFNLPSCFLNGSFYLFLFYGSAQIINEKTNILKKIWATSQSFYNMHPETQN